ncbi:MAG: DUF1285 domain-containing protein [Alphaproteobacteria bacterium]|nr:DUF1285 domain-containing protein [Alphaproteobacteria bacterium]
MEVEEKIVQPGGDPLAFAARLREGQGLPKTHGRAPVFCGDIDMRIARDGTWYYLGSPIGRLPLVKLFASVLHREEDGFYLITPVEKCRIRVDDAPFLAVDVDRVEENGDSALVFRTNLDETVRAGPDRPIRVNFDPETLEPAPYVLVRPGLEALIARSVYYRLVAMGEEREIEGRLVLGVESAGVFYILGRMEA